MAYGPNQALSVLFLSFYFLLEHSHAHSFACHLLYGYFYGTVVE